MWESLFSHPMPHVCLAQSSWDHGSVVSFHHAVQRTNANQRVAHDAKPNGSKTEPPILHSPMCKNPFYSWPSTTRGRGWFYPELHLTIFPHRLYLLISPPPPFVVVFSLLFDLWPFLLVLYAEALACCSEVYLTLWPSSDPAYLYRYHGTEMALHQYYAVFL